MEAKYNINVDTVDGQHASSSSRTLARLDLDNDFGSNSITANTYYGDGSNLTGITGGSNLYYSTVKFPEYSDCVFMNGIVNNDIDIDTEFFIRNYQNYKFYGRTGTTGLQNCSLILKEYIPRGFINWQSIAIEISFLTKTNLITNNYIVVSVGKFGAFSGFIMGTSVASLIGNVWETYVITDSQLKIGATPVNYFSPEDILELKIDIYCDSSNYVKLGQIKFNYSLI